MTAEMPPLYDDLTFLAPLSEARAAQLVRFLSAHLSGTVVDIGCGWAELLIRILETTPGAPGIGLDQQGASLERARQQADAREVGDRLTLIAGDAKANVPASAGGVVCIGASQIWGPPVKESQPLDYRSAFRAIRAILAPGAPLVYGEGIWSAAPNDAAVAPLSGRTDEFVTLAELRDLATECGFAIVQTHEASQDEWDAFESGFCARYARWLASHPADHPDADAVRARLKRQGDAYFRGYRGVLGMAYLALLAV